MTLGELKLWIQYLPSPMINWGDSYGIGHWFSWQFSLLISESVWSQTAGILLQIKTGLQKEIRVFVFLQRTVQCTQNSLCVLHYFWMWGRYFSGASGLVWIIQQDNLYLLLPLGKKVLWCDETRIRPLVLISCSMFGTKSSI